METTGSTHWCYRCDRFVSSRNRHVVICPDCGSGFIEEVHEGDFPQTPFATSAASPVLPRSSSITARAPRRRRRRPQSPSFNPVIVLRNNSDNEAVAGDEERNPERRNYQLYYDDGAGLGLRPLPVSISDFLMGSGFDRLLDQLAHMEINGVGRVENPPAAKSAVESMPVINIDARQVDVEAHCAVCKEAFELGDEAREMPCNHIYHSDCILPWLSLRNSCPVCRYELPPEEEENKSPSVSDSVQDDSVGLTIWRLPGGGFAVGRFAGGQRMAEAELPAVYTEMDGNFNDNSTPSGAPRRITWGSSVDRSGGERRGLGRAFRSVLSFFRRGRSSGSQSSDLRATGRSRSSSIFRRRQIEEWTFGV